MKIEKVNENQIRCTLTKEELADRQIKLSELAYGSDKAKTLFRDMIEQANVEFGFEVDDIPVVVEAIPLSGETIILQITKVEYPEELDTRFSRFSEPKEQENDVENEAALFANQQGADDVLEMKKPVEKSEQPICFTKLFEAKSLEQMERLSHILDGYYFGKNDIFKDEKKNRFYLVVRKEDHSPEEFNKVCNVISEYALNKKYTPATEAYLHEHGKLIIKDQALQTLMMIGM